MTSSDLLYVSADLAVRRVGAGDGRRQVVTFDSYHDVAGFDRPGFGEAFFAEQGITAIHLLTRGNDWFQYRDLPQALAIVRAAVRGSDRVMSYGSSMGGYGAVRFAAAVGADVALALSPQHSVAPRRSRFDPRWRQDRRRIRFLKTLDGPIRGAARTIIAYDPKVMPDRRHVDAIAAAIPIERIALPFAGHAVGAFLVETRLLTSLVLDTLSGEIDPGTIARDAHARRARSSTWLGELAGHQPPARPRCAIALAERAVALDPANAAVMDGLALRHRAAGAFDRAVAAHRRAIALDPVHNYIWSLGKTLEAAGRVPEALAEARLLEAAAPDVAGYAAWAAMLHARLGEPAAALTAMRRALARAPANHGYRLTAWGLALHACWARLTGGRPRAPR